MSDKDTIYTCFSNQVTNFSDRLAVFDENKKLTYQDLDNMINAIANQLLVSESSSKIGIVMDHGVEMIASILAILKIGAAYVPAEPNFPPERINFMMDECNVSCIITQKKYADKLQKFPLLFIEDINLGKNEPVTCGAKPESLAYVLYTSGSTGKPKGVCVENRNVCHYVRAFQNEFHISEKDIMLQYSVCSFDIFTEEVFSTLLSGTALAIPSEKTKSSIYALMHFVEENGVTIISGFPYLMADLNKLSSIPSGIRLLISGGDVLRKRYITNLMKQAVIYNTYGPSETTCCASYFRCKKDSELEDGSYPIGKAVLGSSISILDENLKPVKKGEVGEICVMGGGLARGYMGNRENQSFITKEDGTRLYRSGDLGYELPDGNIAFVKRKDSQVMILGKRIEAAEVESVLCNYADVAAGIIRPEVDTNGLSYLTAYVIPANENFCVSKLKRYMEQYLAPFMIPEFFVLMKEFPLTLNGKPNRIALPKVLKEGAM